MQVFIKENKTQYKRLRNQMRKIVARAVRKNAEQELNDLHQNSNSAFCLLGKMIKEGKNMEGGRCQEADDWVLLHKTRQKFGRNTWKRL